MGGCNDIRLDIVCLIVDTSCYNEMDYARISSESTLSTWSDVITYV